MLEYVDLHRSMLHTLIVSYNVKLWMIHPNIMPQSVLENAGADTTTPRPPRVEYIATLSRHSAAVNVVRWSPNGTRWSAFCSVDTNVP